MARECLFLQGSSAAAFAGDVNCGVSPRDPRFSTERNPVRRLLIAAALTRCPVPQSSHSRSTTRRSRNRSGSIGTLIAVRMETLLVASNGAMRTEMSLSVRTPWFVGAFVLCAVALVSGDDRPSSASAALTARSGSQVLPAEWYDEDQWHLDVRYLISAQEVSEYKALKTVEAREAFVTRFWTR